MAAPDLFLDFAGFVPKFKIHDLLGINHNEFYYCKIIHYRHFLSTSLKKRKRQRHENLVKVLSRRAKLVPPLSIDLFAGTIGNCRPH